ncbi:MAG: molybdopterin dinucleotide binding domain-containing protein [Dehalococcoidia bacterium]|nr:molybdopterin dinucleotide binding domain-containing protein [Dehalococcoidia bacterium]
MTTPQSEILLTVVVHDDVYLPVTVQRNGYGEAYQQKAAVVKLSRADMEKLGLKDSAKVELTAPEGSVVVAARSEPSCDPGLGFMPSSLYTNRLAHHDSRSRFVPGKHIQARAVPTAKDITPISDLKVRRSRA